VFKRVFTLKNVWKTGALDQSFLQSADLNERLNLTLTESLQTINTLKKASSYRRVHNSSQDGTYQIFGTYAVGTAG